MGRVERRMYKQRRRRKWRLFLLILLAAALVLAWKMLPEGFISEHIPMNTKTPIASFDQTVETREMTLPAETWYAIQTGVFSSEDAAKQKADAYASRGAPGTIVRDGDKWRVFIACYETEADASSVRTRLESHQRVDTYLYAWKLPEVRLRLTGKAGQLDTVEAGFTLLVSAAATLRDAAIDLDAAQISNAEAASSVQALDDGIALWEETVRSRFGRTAPELLKSMLAITDAWDDRRDAILAASNATDLSSALKAQAMGMYDDLISWRNAMLAQ